MRNENLCCRLSLEDKDEDLELVDNCFKEASNLSEAELSNLGFKESISFDDKTSVPGDIE